MKVANMLGERFKNAPKDCVIESHALMMRGGYMKYMANGIFSLYTPAKRIMRKIEQIIREEMDAVDGQEVMFPVVMPASLWEESGRYTSIGSEMARWKDRSGNPMVLGMTHEEAAVHLARDTAQSYADFPFMIYQIQTKFRDEPRARGGLIRVREFTMKDAYSFHTSQADLERYYARVYDAYNRIFERCGCKNFISVQSDSGMMGGSISHEFMLLTEVGEDTLAICDCGYRANMEAAETLVDNAKDETLLPLTEVFTGEAKTIEEVCELLKSDAKKSCKAVVYQRNMDDSLVIAFLRGDLEVNETKLTNYLGEKVHPAVITQESGIVAGYPVVDVRVELYDGSYHEVDSSEMAFKIAGSMAFKSAMRKADPVLLEPLMKVSVFVPEQYMGDVFGDLNGRRGQIQGMEPRGAVQAISAAVPLSEMFGYATDLRSMTQGRGSFTCKFIRYEEAPGNVQQKVIEEAKALAEAE